ncbi:MAG: DUF4349 domain-containing protein [Rickettsiales bacterium]|jgi:hypothetical protein|nr:DUF4349 domain-containing protein [Rickettsiales bacterium]
MREKIKSFLGQNWGVAVLLLYIFLGNSRPPQGVVPMVRKNQRASPMALTANEGAASAAAGGFMFKNRAMASDMVNGGERKIAKNLNISIETKAAEIVRADVEKYVGENGGFVDNFYSYDYHGKFAYNFSIKIPADGLDALTKYAKSKGLLKSENFSLSDRTEAYADNENRLKNLTARRDSLRELLSSKVAQLSDVIAVEKELNNVQYEIERFERENRRIQQTVDYSSVNLTILPEIVLDGKTAGWKFSKSFGAAANLFVKFCQISVDCLLTLLIFSPAILALFLFYKIYRAFRARWNRGGRNR